MGAAYFVNTEFHEIMTKVGNLFILFSLLLEQTKRRSAFNSVSESVTFITMYSTKKSKITLEMII